MMWFGLPERRRSPRSIAVRTVASAALDHLSNHLGNNVEVWCWMVWVCFTGSHKRISGITDGPHVVFPTTPVCITQCPAHDDGNVANRVIDAMPELMARRLETVWCDSNAGACYTVTVRRGLWVPNLRWAIADAVKQAGGGHNGIVVEADGGNGGHIDPD